MDDPQRLMDGPGTALERTLLQELRSYRGPKDMRAHTLAALGMTGTAGLAASGALAWWSGKTLAAKLLITASVASVLVGIPTGYFLTRQRSTPLPPPAAPTVAPVSPEPPLKDPATSTTPEAPSHPSSTVLVPAARMPRRGGATGADLRAELEALDGIRATLAGGNFFKALSLLDAYFQHFHHGRLQLEAEILRIDALARSGQTDGARAYAKEFLRRNPKSVHAARLQSLVGP